MSETARDRFERETKILQEAKDRLQTQENETISAFITECNKGEL